MLTQVKKIHIKVCASCALLLAVGALPTQAMAQDQDPTSASPATATKLEDPTLAQSKSSADSDHERKGAEVSVTAEDEADEEKRDRKKWSLTVGASTRVYQGMFVKLQNQSADYTAPNASDSSDAFSRWSNAYTLDGSYKVKDVTLVGGFGVSQWLTRGGGTIEPYEVRVSDVALGAEWKGYKFDAIDTRLTAGYAMTLPVSVYSRTSNLILGNALSLGLSRTFFDKLNLTYAMTGGWTPHSTTSPTVDKEVAQIFREDDIIGNEIQVLGGVSTEFSWTNTLAASFPIWDKLNASVTYSYSKYWSHYRDLDPQYNAPLEGLQTGGRNTGDAVTGTAGLSYSLNDYLTFAGGISSSQSPKTADNKGFRFPWWNFSGAGANLSLIYVRASATF